MVVERTARPRGSDDLDRLDESPVALVEGYVEGGELLDEPAGADAEQQPAARHILQGGG